MDEAILQEARENIKTQFLMSQFDVLVSREQELVELASDPEMAALVEDEKTALTSQKQALYDEVARIVESSRVEEERPYGVILEVRAGAGGEEAALFAEELAAMYSRAAQRMRWSCINTSESRSSQGGFKEATFEIISPEAYDHLLFCQ